MYVMLKGMEILYYNLMVAYILDTSKEVQSKLELISIGVDFQENEIFKHKCWHHGHKLDNCFLKTLPKKGNGTNSTNWPNNVHLKWECKSTQSTWAKGNFSPTPQVFTYGASTPMD